MTSPINANADNPGAYVIDSSLVEEMARLLLQDSTLTAGMGGVLAEQEEHEIAAMGRVLDIACGPGGWALEVARHYPHLEVTGFDLSRRMIEVAQAQAQAGHLTNVQFSVGDLFQMREPHSGLSPATFDLVNARLVSSLLQRDAWPHFLADCLALLRPGGILRVSEQEIGMSTGPTCEQLSGWIAAAFLRAGRAFSPSGQMIGITLVLPRLLRQAGCQDVRVRSHAIEYSAGTPFHTAFRRDAAFAYPLLLPFLQRTGVMPDAAAFPHLMETALAEMQQEDFCGMVFMLTCWGRKPIT